jgi:hypothetical protein
VSSTILDNKQAFAAARWIPNVAKRVGCLSGLDKERMGCTEVSTVLVWEVVASSHPDIEWTK